MNKSTELFIIAFLGIITGLLWTCMMTLAKILGTLQGMGRF